MSTAPKQAAPAWQTEELQDEWIELDEQNSDDDHNLTYGTRSISLTAPLTTHIHANNQLSLSSPQRSSPSPPAAGTFLVRDDVPNDSLLPRTPGLQKKGLMKNFFSQTPLERMFDPPSPPSTRKAIMLPTAASSRSPSVDEKKLDEIVPTGPPKVTFHGRKTSMDCQFTFSVPRTSFLNSKNDSTVPQAQSTPNPLTKLHRAAPATDSRLRLFQFQYDTYTRDHLSAMVDSIAINSGSGTGTTPSPTVASHVLSRVSEVTDSVADISHLRSAKRVKLSPPSDFYGEGAGEGASIARPKVLKDYVGESRSLMQQIKQARDFSTISTVASNSNESPSHQGNGASSNDRRSSFLHIPPRDDWAKCGTSPTSNYREQAATLMAQIRQDMKGHKRMLSEDTVASHSTARTSGHPGSGSLNVSRRSSESKARQQQVLSPRRSSSTKSHSPKHKSSLRESTRASTSTARTNDQQLVDDLSKLSTHDRRSFSDGLMVHSTSGRRQPVSRVSSLSSTHLAVPSNSHRPSFSSRMDDINRLVSSSTTSGTTSGATTLSAGSVPSFVKHAGPTHIRTIAPTDLPELPDTLGDMMFDKVMMRWVKNNAKTAEGVSAGQEEASEDPFGDIESLRDEPKSVREKTADEQTREQEQEVEIEDDVPGVQRLMALEMSRIEEQSEVDEEEMDMTSFMTDNPSAMIVEVMTGASVDDNDETTDSDDDDGPTSTGELKEYDSDDSLDQPPNDRDFGIVQELLSPPHQTPHRPQIGTTVIRSAMKSRSATPTSVLKDPSRSKYQTPRNKKNQHRSVSFSDGKREGPIQGLGESTDGSEVAVSPGNATGSGFVPSVRSRRIAQMMEALEDTESHGSPWKTGSEADQSQLHALVVQKSKVNVKVNVNEGNEGRERQILSRSHTRRISISEEEGVGNATFLTECSFAVAHDRLVEVITDVQPFVPRWEDLNSIDLSEKKLESVARLKEFLPRLDALNLNSNHLAWLSGVPGTVRTLSVASNSLSRLTSYGHLVNLENLDISQNDIGSLRQLACLRHLRELRADGNKITSIDGLEGLDGLVKLSLEGNCVESLDVGQCRWTRLEILNVSRNRVESVRGVGSLQGLVALNLDNNGLRRLEIDLCMGRLRILRVSDNRLGELEVGNVPHLRTLYADNNALTTVSKLERLTKLENLSLRNQGGRGLKLVTRDIRDVKRLYLSGNGIPEGLLSEACYNLVYLELAGCGLTALPPSLGTVVPNVRVLNLNYNFVEDAGPLGGLRRLRKLTMIGSRLGGTRALIRVLAGLGELEVVDFRMNPCTLGWYLPVLGTGGGREWEEMDRAFRRGLPDGVYVGRLAYRGLVMEACPAVRVLDGVAVSRKERAKAGRLLAGLGQANRRGI